MLSRPSCTVTYSGSNDEGYIDDITSDPPAPSLDYGTELYRQVQDEVYAVLEQHHGGWEINEGSHGHITINVKERKAFLHHGEHVQTTTYYDSEVA